MNYEILAENARFFTISAAILTLAFAFYFYKWMRKQDEGNETMKEIASHVRSGAIAYLKQQYKVIAFFFAGAFIIFAILSYALKVQNPFIPIGFLTGGFFSTLSGFLGMKTATYASARTANAASKSLNEGLTIAFRSGAVMGLTVVGLALFDISLWFIVLNVWLDNSLFGTDFLNLAATGIAKGTAEYTAAKMHFVTTTMLSFGVGASFQALFARVGGGIFTKAADVGADLVGKVEAGIPEDDPRNPAVIADNVGDNVGDVAGMGADLYESYAGSILAAMSLGSAAFGYINPNVSPIYAVSLPMILAAIGTLSSIIGVFFVKTKEGATMGELLKSLRVGVYVSSAIIIVVSFLLVKALLPNNLGLFVSIIVGLIAGNVVGFFTEYYTAAEYRPTQWVAEQSKTGPATVIIGGLAVGMQSTLIPVVTVVISIMLAFGFAGGFGSEASSFSQGLYGIALASVGMLSTLGITLATDAYGPIADNAGGNAEMSGLPESVRERTDALDSLGNTTAATGKGFAICSAALTAMALIAAYIEEIKTSLGRMINSGNLTSIDIGTVQYTANSAKELYDKVVYSLGMNEFMNAFNIHLMNPKVLIGIFIGAMLVFFFCALTMKAVGRAAAGVVEEVRRQFREIKGLLAGEKGVKADYEKAVQICTKSAQKEMIVPSVLAIIVPVVVGFLFGVPAVIGMLVGGLTAGFAMAVMMSNAGGAWDNAKKYIGAGNLGGKKIIDEKTGEKISYPNQAAAVIGDTVGDPFKDTSGPSINILIKLMSLISVVFAGAIVAFSPKIQALLGIADQIIK
ncbi:sodium-translocating pyrophosphatase [Brachyspira hampsonii]|uniref:sodium-translocating pyrophosphatase n=1 Tax=Brachyspira hampsonii TaxID=1287055 RepID=UPI001CA4F798|nr:sodium-translocating pyrophosphatase [Brachyspira hampsonii]MBW5394097.1 sodium-translocating pyrophosphatase [Brachyspira hampsonii]